MSYVYLKTEPQLWTVGFYDPKGEWHPDLDFDSKEEAADRVAYLNGAARMAELNATIKEVRATLRDLISRCTDNTEAGLKRRAAHSTCLFLVPQA